MKVRADLGAAGVVVFSQEFCRLFAFDYGRVYQIGWRDGELVTQALKPYYTA
jgi:hypothetical protein